MNFDSAPAWAYNGCYYILGIVGVFILYSIMQVVKVYMATKSVSMTALMGLVTLITASIGAFVFMMNFWICRSALKPSQ